MTAVTDHRPSAGAIPDSAELVARVTELHPLIRANAAPGEEARRVAEPSMQALREAGILRIAQPRRYGGYETSMRTMLDVSAAVGEADGGTAWVVTLLNVCAWMVGTYPRQAQDDVWKDNPDALVSGVLAPTAEARKVDGGYRVTGRWYWNSGSWHADWAVLGIPITDEAGEVVDQGLALIPRTDLDLEETWFVAGMKSTGSNCLIASDIFVPEHRIVSVRRPSRGTTRPSSPARPSTVRPSSRSWPWCWPARSSAWAGPRCRSSRRRRPGSRFPIPSTPRSPIRSPSSCNWPRRRC